MRQPLGFVALLGVVALIGMIVRNSVILVHEIEIEKAKGLSDWDAVVEATSLRFRPSILTAVAAILGGLAVATALMLIFLPSLYVICFKIQAK